MFLSDLLIETGKQANPKNNLSMGNVEKVMQTQCQQALATMTEKQIQNSVGFACAELNKAGFPLYKPEHIF